MRKNRRKVGRKERESRNKTYSGRKGEIRGIKRVGGIRRRVEEVRIKGKTTEIRKKEQKNGTRQGAHGEKKESVGRTARQTCLHLIQNRLFLAKAIC